MATTFQSALGRWIFASVADYFSNNPPISTGLPLLVEGIDEREPEKIDFDHAELRISGPFAKEESHGFWRIWVDINVLLIDNIGGATENTFNLFTWGGEIQELMTGRIPIYRYGSEGGDDSSYVGCLTPRWRKENSVRLIHFGQISRVDRIRQSAVDGQYEMYLEL